MKTEPRRFRSNLIRLISGILVAIGGVFPAFKIQADGCFVVPKFVWDKHKDINEPTQKAIIAYDSGHEDLILQVKYDGPVEEFGWLIPVPNVPTVKEGTIECFYELSEFTQRLWEPPVSHGADLKTLSARSMGETKPEPVKVVEIKTVGSYEVAVLSARDTVALKQWLEANQFSFPQEKESAIESYIKNGWYFVAARINLEKEKGFSLLSKAKPRKTIEQKLSSGELRPLHLSFASDRCVFPLKVSSINGKPSEVQVYVLSQEPLLEKGMFERTLPGIYSNDVVNAQRQADWFERELLLRARLSSGVTNLQLSALQKDEVRRRRETLRVSGELPHFVNVTKSEFPICGKEIPSLAEGDSWFLIKETWTFKPEEMRDLIFEPAIPFLIEKLDSKYGYYTAACLGQYGAQAVFPVLRVLRGTNAAARATILSAFDYTSGLKLDEQALFRSGARELITDSDPAARRFAVLHGADDTEFLLKAMHDEDFQVAGLAGGNLMHSLMYRPGAKKYIPQVQEMLKDEKLSTRAAALEALRGVQIKIPREDLLQFFTMTNLSVVWTACTKLDQEGEEISNPDLIPMLNNGDPTVRMLGLKLLYGNAEKSGVDLALPLLRDSEPQVVGRAEAVLRGLTGQHFKQAGEWERWWNENKATFGVQQHPEEFMPSRTNLLQF